MKLEKRLDILMCLW